MDGNKEPSKGNFVLKRFTWNLATRFFIIMIVSIIISEMIIMIAFHFLHPPKFVELFGDSIFLAILVSPSLYLFFYRPLIKEHLKAVESKQKLAELNANLETHIAERTSVLTNLNTQMQIQTSALQAAANGIMITDRNGTIVWVNAAFTLLTGYTINEVIGKNPRFLKSGQQSQKYYEDLWKTVISGQVWHGEIINRRKNGSLYAEEMTVTPVKSASNEGSHLIAIKQEISHFIAIKQDVTERNKNSEDLKQSEERLRKITDAVPGVVYRYSINRQGVQKFLFLSLFAETLFGIPVEKLQNDFNLAWALVLPEEVEALWQSIKTATETLKPWSYEFKIKDTHGNLKWVQGHSAPEIPQADGTIIWNGIFFDITPRKKSERSLKDSEEKFRQSQKMNALGQLAGGIAHDLNNQLTPVGGYIDLLLQQTDPGHSNYQMLTEASQSAERCAEVIRRLTQFSRPTTQKKTTILLSGMFKELKLVIEKFLPSTIQVRFNCEKDIWPIEANETEIQTVLMNLFVNARDAMPQGGHLTVEANNIDLSGKPGEGRGKVGQYVLISITDTGSGMSSDVAERIFEPFFTTKEKGKGTGLGLAMVFKIIQEHQGWIDVSSKIGQGTTFHIYLPAKPGATVSSVKTQTGIHEHLLARNETILFADDEKVVRNFGKILLDRLGYKVLMAHDGEEAVKLYQENLETVDVLMLDMTMPKMTGVQMIQNILKLNPKAKIIATSGYTAEGTSQELIQQGAADFIQKPYTIITLAQVLRKVIDQGR